VTLAAGFTVTAVAADAVSAAVLELVAVVGFVPWR